MAVYFCSPVLDNHIKTEALINAVCSTACTRRQRQRVSYQLFIHKNSFNYFSMTIYVSQHQEDNPFRILTKQKVMQ